MKKAKPARYARTLREKSLYRMQERQKARDQALRGLELLTGRKR